MIILSRLKVSNYKSLRDIDLEFPRRASILIEGLNEAGKSTLFEAVYFALYGEPLITEDGSGRSGGKNESAVNYQSDKATVVLELEISETILKISRTLHKGTRATEATLKVRRPGLAPETVSTQTAVNRRVIEELGGLDKEALLNSCFVEQKKLDRLEQLGTADRRATLERLLNLDKLQFLQEQFKVTRQAEEEVRQAEQRVILAELQADLPKLARNLNETRLKLTAISLLVAFEEITGQEALLNSFEETRVTLEKQILVLEDRLQRAQVVRQVREEMINLSHKIGEIERLEDEAAGLGQQLADLERRETVEKPGLENRLAALVALQNAMDELVSYQATKAELNRNTTEFQNELSDIAAHEDQFKVLDGEIYQAEAELNELIAQVTGDEKEAQAGISELEPKIKALENLFGLLTDRDNLQRDLKNSLEKEQQTQEQFRIFARLKEGLSESEREFGTRQTSADEAELNYQKARRAYDIAVEIQALEKWLQGYGEMTGQSSDQSDLAIANQKVIEAGEKVTAQQKALAAVKTRTTLTGGLAGGALLLGVGFIFLAVIPGAAFLVIALLLAGFTAKQASEMKPVRQQLDAAQKSLVGARQFEIQVKATSAAKATLGGSQFKLNEAQAALREMGAAVPENQPKAVYRLNLLRHELPGQNDPRIFRQAIETARTERDKASQLLTAARVTSESKKEQLKSHPAFNQPEPNPETPSSKVQTVRLNELTRHIQDSSNELGLTPERNALQAEWGKFGKQISLYRNQFAGIPGRQETIGVRQQHLSARQQNRSGLAEWLNQHDRTGLEARLVESNQKIVNIDRLIEAQEIRVKQSAANLEINPVAFAVQQSIGTVDSQLAQIRRDLENRPAIINRQESLLNDAQHQRATISQTWQGLLPLPEGAVFQGTGLPSAGEWGQLIVAVQTALNQLNEAEASNQRQELSQQLGHLNSEIKATIRSIEDWQKNIRDILARYGLQAAPIFEMVAAVFPLVTQVQKETEPELIEQENQLKLELGVTRQRMEELAARLNLVGEDLSVEESSDQLRGLKYELEVRRRAGLILGGVLRTMVEKVLPGTISYMRLLLPALTMDRYRDCKITPDYKIQVWDEIAGRYVAKNIFSGGTRDQFSLALRLSFALATLPENLGTTPGFIFLDEPLSSFDNQRSDALVNLLTHGEIAQKFSQIFVISHNRMFNEQSFTHRVQIEGGRVAGESLLKSGQVEEQLAF